MRYLLLALVLLPRTASAYTWMIRHGYTGCNQCHADPSGGGLLTAYGRAQSEILLRTDWTGRGDEAEAGRQAEFLFGAFHLPDALLLGADFRGMWLDVEPQGAPSVSRWIWMQQDVQGQLTIGRFRANGSIGWEPEGALPATLMQQSSGNLISREHWIGVDLGEDRNVLLRAGRIAVPFGIRFLEHNFFVRQTTRTDINDQQQYGVAVAYGGESWRAEGMAIAGNLEVSPAEFREYGASGYAEWTPKTTLALGASSLATHADKDIALGTPLWRQAHGIFVRAAPWKRLVILAETDLLVSSQPPGNTRFGYVGVTQLDLEPIQGIHVIAAGEVQDPPPQHGLTVGAWGSLAWFFAPHADVRADAVWDRVDAGGMTMQVTTLLAQLHVFL